MDEFTKNYLEKYIDPVVTVIKIDNYKKKGTTIDNITTSNPITKIIVDNIGITHDGKLERYLSKNETLGYNFITNNIKNTSIPLKCDKKNYSTISIVKSKTKRKIKKIKNKYKITLNINVKGNITEYNCTKDLNKVKNIEELEKIAEKKIKYYVNSALDVNNNSSSEFLGLKRMIYLEDKNYNNEDYDIKVNVKVNLKRKGEISNNIKGDKYE